MTSGCLKETMEYREKPFIKEFLADEKGYFSIFEIGYKISDEEFAKRGIDNLQQIRYESSLRSAKETVPSIKTTQTPYFIIFDDKKIVLETHHPDEVFRFLKRKQ